MGNIIKSFAETGDVANTQVGNLNILLDHYNRFKPDDLIIGGTQKFSYSDLESRLLKIKKQLGSIIESLNAEEKLILDLPLLEWKLGYEFGAYCMLNWLEGSTGSLKFTYKKFMEIERLKNIDINSIDKYFSGIRYFSVDNLGYVPSGDNIPNKYLYNTSIGSVKNAHDLFLRDYKKYLDTGKIIGDYENFNTHISGSRTKNNFFNSFDFGSFLGNFDDIGVALGMFSLRVYYRGYLYTSNTVKLLEIQDIATRFVDTYSFNDNYSWYSQPLGCWNTKIETPQVARTKWNLFGDKICVENRDFRNLKSKANDKGVKIGGDFLIYSDHKIHNNDTVQKKVIVYI